MNLEGLYADFKNVLKSEANAIVRTASLISESHFEKALSILIQCKGKAIIVGVGKPGHVAKKMAATFTSTSLPAITLSVADALHGDIGIVQPEDVAILISNSGETQELLTLLPHLKLRKIPIIAIVGNVQSTLARQAAAVLNAGVEREACILNLAPTTSTTVAMAIGDALAVCLMQYKGVKSEDFAFNHPSGQLGRLLSLTAYELSHKNTATVLPETPWEGVIQVLGDTRLGAVAVVGADGTLLGLITDGDIRRLIQKLPAYHQMKAAEMMTQKPLAAHEDMTAYEALRLMENRPTQISVLPLTDSNSKYLGMLRIHDILGKL